MKKNPRLIGIILAVVSVVCVASGISLITEKEIGPAFLAFVFAAALGYFAYRMFFKQKANDTTNVPVPSIVSTPKATVSEVVSHDADMQVTEKNNTTMNANIDTKEKPKTNFKEEMFTVAGVTFKNDNGTSRQRILREIYVEESELGLIDAELEEYLYEGRPAIRVNTARGCIGNIRSSDVSRVLEIMHSNNIVSVYLFPDKFKDVETGKTIYRADVSVSYPNND